jgi:pimeloyl-ACP methyl ester carboxylesterase
VVGDREQEDDMNAQTETYESRATMTHVVSRDGTRIAYFTSGHGPPLLIVHGTSGAHERFAPLLPFLEPHATVHVMDRRGRGGSGDAPEYELAREFEDVAAAVDAIAASSGSKVDVYGHSYGGECAFGAALLTSNIRSLVLYEGWPPVLAEKFKFPVGVAERLDALVASGDREAALELFWRAVVKVSDEDIGVIRAQPSWAARVATVHTITREFRAFFGDTFDPEVAARITVPVLLLAGTDTPDDLRDDPETVAAALPDARIAYLEGQQHIADVLAPELFAERVLEFLHERP